MYKIGDKVVYPHHGAGTVVKKESREVLGTKREYLTIKILHNDMTVQVPCENADAVGLRRVIGEKEVGVVLKALTGGSTEMPKNWNRRFKHNRDKMKTGDVLELAEVVRNLSLRDHEKGLSTGEKQMFVKAKKILASELMYAKTMDEDECAEWLEEVLAERRQRQEEGDGFEEEGRRRDRVDPRSCPSGRSSSPLAAARGSAWSSRRHSRSSARIRSSPSRCAASTSRTGSTRSSSSRRRAGRSRRSCSPRRCGAARRTPCVRGRRDAHRLGQGRSRRGARRRARRARARCRAAVLSGRRDRARARAALGRLGRRRARAPALRHAEAGRRRTVPSSRPSRATRCTRCRRRRPSRPTCSAARSRGGADATDCAGLVEAAGGRVKVVEGDPRLLKVTTADDLAKIASWLR